MADNENNRQTTGVSPMKTVTRSEDSLAKTFPESPDPTHTNGAWADEKAAANARHDRASGSRRNMSPGDALVVGGGQQSTPYQLATQADAIAKQTKRGDI